MDRSLSQHMLKLSFLRGTDNVIKECIDAIN